MKHAVGRPAYQSTLPPTIAGRRGLGRRPRHVERATAAHPDRLYAVGNHEGTLDYGHYYADCKGKTGQWHRFNDAVVTPTTVERLDPQTCYMLFYHRVPNE